MPENPAIIKSNPVLLQVRDLWKSYPQPEGRIAVLSGACLTLETGVSVALRGDSGSGKSTLLHLLAGLDQADRGEILWQGRELRHFNTRAWSRYRREHIGLIFQNYHLIPSLNVADNIRLQARLAGRDDPVYFRKLCAQLGLQKLQARLPHELSGGQQQRVAIARALLVRPQLILADEPTGNLDPESSIQVLQALLEGVRASQCSLVLVTHSLAMARHTDRHFRLVEGQIIADQDPALADSPHACN